MRSRKPLADWELRAKRRNWEEQNLQRIGHVQLNHTMKSDTRKITAILVDQLFSMDEVSFDQRVRVDSIHLEGEAIAYHRSYMRSRSCVVDLSWTEYILALNDRFGEEFEDSVKALKSDSNRQMQSPRTLLQAYKLARLQEDVFYAQVKTWCLKPMVRPVQGPILPTPTHVKPPFSQKPFAPNSTYRKPVDSHVAKPNRFTGNGLGRRLTAAEMDEKRAKGLCFFCDDKYVTIRVTGYHEKKPLQVLIDTASTHNFIDQEVAKRLGCQTTTIMTQSISVADGRKVQTGSVCKNLTWLLQGTTFSSDFLLLPLGNMDIVLGVQWLNTLGRILFDFQSRTIEFRYQGKKDVLRGASSQLKPARAKSINKVEVDETQFFMMSLLFRSEDRLQCYNIHVDQGNLVHPALSLLIDQYAIIFEIPTTLPPHRGSFDHHIPLVESANPVNKRPYRYPGVKKDIIEKLVHEMIDHGVIQHGTSPYVSPVVLVGKKDGSWRLCVDYRELNNLTVKDRFPIPIIEDLLDELGGSMEFSKIDLRDGYHQLRMFIQGFGSICKPLHVLLKKDGYTWTEHATTTFEELKQALISTPVLAMLDYSKPFVVETNSSGKGIGVVLMQESRPIAYVSRSLDPRHQVMFVYDRELVALIFVVTKWSHYLIGKPFIVKTDQKALKHLLEQNLHTDFQVAGISKLMAFDFSVEYKKGIDNKVVYALSRKPDSELLAISLLTPNDSLYEHIKGTLLTDTALQTLITKLHVRPFKSFT
ncbi:hypothetical protein KY289_001190 [Solanum tuberosum]|nr:hypothetical protein KY289_001190 [Solanum tuberosum]